MMNRTLLIMLFTCLYLGSFAQDLLAPSFSYSRNKTAYLTLSDGKKVEGTIKSFDRKKGLIEEIKIKTTDGKKMKFKPEDVKFMYLPPSGLDNLSKALDKTFDTQKWGDEDIEHELIKDGYVYFELADVKVKKKTRKLLMQLLNPTFSKQVKIYHDPFAKETMSVGVGSFTVAGGHAKSYYVAKDNKVAVRLKKKDYKEEFATMWKGCDAVYKTYDEAKWLDLTKHALTYSECGG